MSRLGYKKAGTEIGEGETAHTEKPTSRLTERADLAGPSRVGSFVVGCPQRAS